MEEALDLSFDGILMMILMYSKLPYLLLFYEIEEVGNCKSENIFVSNTAEIVDG